MRPTSRILLLLVASVAVGSAACTTAPPSTENLLAVSDEQMKLRNMQTRSFDIEDRKQAMRAVIAALQDLGFQIEVLDAPLGIVSAKQYLPISDDVEDRDATYLLYDEESLVVFQNAYRTWGPFERRLDLIRLTVTVRKRNEGQLIVRAAVQHYLRPVETPEPYQRFYAALQQSLFSDRVTASED